ncbi:hypothetical protein PV05_08490 [Exophiala xenobiotica]|uniref:SnoaL-like domain-containing protein n=1 Tax=Exophiala xenobiotica TaxID=348802 RepID=A0A0D2CS66_9EURO|nr:uncharacterized protein PV05_08490 [Exophiala xenobiotica]KIW52877.1 hypothetical protein PV05_08490 [Exophiala xenobiotica]
MTQNHRSPNQIIWPNSIKDGPIPTTIQKFFQSADDATHEGSIAFSKCFSQTGELLARGYTCKGHEELIKFRQGAWDVITYRKHEPRKVYTSASDEKDLVVLGNVMFRHKNGQRVTQEFVGNFIFDEVRDEEALIQSYQAWLDSKPLADLMAGGSS